MSTNDRLTDLIAPKTQTQASYTVHTQATYYPEYVRIYFPDKPYDKLLPGYEPTKKHVLKSSVANQNSEDDIERSLRRTKKTIRDYAICNYFELFATFTFKNDRKNV